MSQRFGVDLSNSQQSFHNDDYHLMEEEKEERFGFVDELGPIGNSRDPWEIAPSDTTEPSGFNFMESQP
jgi:hypothetical protein